MSKQDRELISVIVPVFNIDGYICRCINSILNQSYQNIEIVLSDDGSSDKSAEATDEVAVAESNVIVIYKRNAEVLQASLI